MITISQIMSATRETRSDPDAARRFQPLAEAIASYKRMDFNSYDSDQFRRGCRASAEAGILEDLCGGKHPQTVAEERISGGDLWVFTRLPIAAEHGIEPRGKQPQYECPCCEGTIPHGEKCPKCGEDIWANM